MWKLLFCFMIIPCNIAAMAVVADYSNKSIVDDYIAQAIRGIKPASITDLINSLKKRSDTFKEITSLDVCDNNIGLSGSIKLFLFIKEYLPHLECMNLSFNLIRDYRGSYEYDEFELLLIELITKDSFKTISLGGNYLDIDWYNHMRTILPTHLYEKIL